MPKVICLLENASDEINGVKFAPFDGEGILSEDISDEVAAVFLSIKGYVAEGVEGEDDDDNNSNTGGNAPETPTPAPVVKKETPAERKARLKAEQEAADQEKADEEAEAARLAAEQAAADAAAKQSDDAGKQAGAEDEVF